MKSAEKVFFSKYSTFFRHFSHYFNYVIIEWFSPKNKLFACFWKAVSVKLLSIYVVNRFICAIFHRTRQIARVTSRMWSLHTHTIIKPANYNRQTVLKNAHNNHSSFCDRNRFWYNFFFRWNFFFLDIDICYFMVNLKTWTSIRKEKWDGLSVKFVLDWLMNNKNISLEWAPNFTEWAPYIMIS